MHTVELSPVCLLSSLKNAITFCEPFAKINECHLIIEEEKARDCLNLNSTPMIQANQLRLEQIVINLISNAVKYSGAGKDVHVSLRLGSERDAVTEALKAGTSDLRGRRNEDIERSLSSDIPVAIVTVRDEGRGIPNEEFDCLFGEFSQLSISHEQDNSRKRKSHSIGQPSGSGLGLNLVLKLVGLVRLILKNCLI